MTDTAHTPANPDALPFDPPHAKLPQPWNWDTDGNLTLLETPLLPGYVSRRAADADLARYTRMAIRLCGAGWTLIGGFVGARERLLLDDVAKAHPAFRLVRLEPGPLTESRLDSRLAAAHHAGRLLRLTTAEPHEFCTRALCVRHNRLADTLAGPWRAAVESFFARLPDAQPTQIGHLRAWLAAWPSP